MKYYKFKFSSKLPRLSKRLRGSSPTIYRYIEDTNTWQFYRWDNRWVGSPGPSSPEAKEVHLIEITEQEAFMELL